jgi:hypothetical protein
VGYGEVGGRMVPKRRRASASSTRAEALERDERASVIKECKAEGSGSTEDSVGGKGVQRNVWIMLERRFRVVMIVEAIAFVCWARRCRMARSCDSE